VSRDAFAGLARDEEERDEKIALERRERTEDREHAETVAAQAAADRLVAVGPELLDGFADAIGLLKGCADIMTKIGRPATAATLDTKAAELLALLLKVTKPECGS